jgi:hypothetical protein
MGIQEKKTLQKKTLQKKNETKKNAHLNIFTFQNVSQKQDSTLKKNMTDNSFAHSLCGSLLANFIYTCDDITNEQELFNFFNVSGLCSLFFAFTLLY